MTAFFALRNQYRGQSGFADAKAISRAYETGLYAPTEAKTFEAVRKAINEIASLVGHIINYLNGGQVFITADHGFLFQESAPEPTGTHLLIIKRH